MDQVSLSNINFTEPALQFPNDTTPPPSSHNPLLSVSIPGTSTPDFPLLGTLSTTKAFSSALNHTSPPSTYSTRALSTTSCPPSLAQHEWSQFISDLKRAAALFMRLKTFAIAVGNTSASDTACAADSTTWGAWRYLANEEMNSKTRIQSYLEQRKKRENVVSVVAKWNQRWEGRGVRVAVEVKGKRVGGARGRKETSVIAMEDVKPQAVENVCEEKGEVGVYYGGFQAV